MALNRLRRSVQVFSFAALHSFFLPIAALQARWACLPVLNCHACALAWTACPIGVLVHYSGWQIFPFLVAGFFLMFGLLLGRLFCGWVCPFGTLQWLLYKIPTKKIHLPAWTSYIKYAVLGLMVIAFPFLFGELTSLSFCRICPAAALQVVVPSWLTNGFYWGGTLMAARFLFLALVLWLAIVASRSFCKVFCPIGALLAPLNYVSFWRVGMRYDSCVNCSVCDKACPTEIRPLERAAQGIAPSRHQDCITCHDCQSACPVTKGEGKRRHQTDDSPRRRATNGAQAEAGCEGCSMAERSLPGEKREGESHE